MLWNIFTKQTKKKSLRYNSSKLSLNTFWYWTRFILFCPILFQLVLQVFCFPIICLELRFGVLMPLTSAAWCVCVLCHEPSLLFLNFFVRRYIVARMICKCVTQKRTQLPSRSRQSCRFEMSRVFASKGSTSHLFSATLQDFVAKTHKDLV